MKTLVVGRNSSLGISIAKSDFLNDSFMIDRIKLDEIMFSQEKLKIFLKIQNITNIIYLMVERDVDPLVNHLRSKVNYVYPIQLWEAIQEIPGGSFVWVSSIFANDEVAVSRHPYLHIQNLAHKAIVESRSTKSATYARISFSQIYGSKEFVKHQPFLYRLKDSISKGQDVQLINGVQTKRNFVNVGDVCRVLGDFKTWTNSPNVSCISKKTLSWWEIAEAFKVFFKSDSVITNIEVLDLLENRSYSSQGLEDISSTYILKDLRTVILEGEFS